MQIEEVPQGIKVEKVLIEEPVKIVQEYYLGVVPDRDSRRDVIIVSAKGGISRLARRLVGAGIT